MATKLGLYQAALVEIGEALLGSSGLTEERESRRLLDQVYDSVLAEALENGQWNFAERTVQVDYDTGVSVVFGYAYAFSKPTDWVRTTGLASSEFIDDAPLQRYVDDQTGWYADITPIFVRYVSNDTLYGLNLGAWPQSFTRYVELALADRICERVTQNASKKQYLEKAVKIAKRNALNKDAMRDASRMQRPGSWVQSRVRGFANRRYDRG